MTAQSPPADRPLVVTSRPLPPPFELPDVDAEVRSGPERGFATREDALSAYAGAHALVSWVSDRVDREFLERVGPQLKLVANYAVGFDNIDLDACRAAGVRVSNTPDAVTEGTAECAVMLMLAAARRLTDADRFCRSGEWATQGILGPNDRLGQPLAGRTLLIVGAGRIGYATAVRTLGFGMRVLYTARSRKPLFEDAPLNAQHVELDEGLRAADVVSLHCPLTPETRHLLNADRLALMKPTAILVNTARGPVVDEAALARALRDGRLWAAGLDVFEDEPRVSEALKELPNVVMTPHFGSGSTASRAEMSQLVAANVNAVLAGRDPVTPVA